MNKKFLVFSTVLITTIFNMVSLSALTLPTKDEADLYYKKWKKGAMIPIYDKDGKKTGEFFGPGHIVEFKLPKKVYFSRIAMYDADTDKGTDKYPNVKDDPAHGSIDGAVVYMVGNGNPLEFAPGQQLSVSTDEAMGYGMMLAVLADDQVLFNKLARVVEYYKTKKSKYNRLTSWTIPAKADGKFPEYVAMKKKIDDILAEKGKGWSYNMGKIWDHELKAKRDKQPYDDWWSPIKPKMEDGRIVGDWCVTSGSERTVDGIAMDGELDIAFAFLMAWDKWVGGDNKKQGDVNYLGIACRRFAQIIEVCKDYGRKDGALDHDIIEVLPLGDYNNRDVSVGGAHGLTRPSDWLVASLRSYYECLQSEETRTLVGTLLDQMSHFSNQDENTFNPGVGPSHTGLVPDFCEQEGSKLKPIYTLEKPDPKDSSKTVPMVDEDNVTHFAVNAARVPFRQTMDYLLYGDEYSLGRAMKMVDFLYKVPYENKKSDPFNVAFQLNGNIVDPTAETFFYTNQVLKAAVMTTIYAANKSGESKYDSFFQKYISSFDHFDSQYSTWNDTIGYTRTDKDGKTLTDYFEFRKDPAHSGYFEDCWTAMALYMMSGSWKAPHPWKSEFDNSTNGEDVKYNMVGDSGNYAKITKKASDHFVVEMKKNPNTKSIVFRIEDFKSLKKSGYSLMSAIERTDGSGTTHITARMYYKDNASEDVRTKGEFTITENDLTRCYMNGFPNVNKENVHAEGVVEFTIQGGLTDKTKFTFTKTGIYDPDVEKARYRYVDTWKSSEPYYYVGDYVRHNQETWMCVEDHATTRSSAPGYNNNKLWEISDYSLIGERWEANRFYADATLVYYKGKTYMAKTPFWSIYAPPIDHTNWMIYYNHNSGGDEGWFSTGNYAVGDLVQYDGNIYKCKVSHTANAAWNPEAAFTLWEKVNSLFSEIDPFPWEEWTAYQAGSVVMYQGVQYECVIGHTSQPGWDPKSVATLWNKK